jgi:hypothetical protein
MSVSSIASGSTLAALLATSQAQSQGQSQVADPPNDGDSDDGGGAMTKALTAANVGQVIDKFA